MQSTMKVIKEYREEKHALAEKEMEVLKSIKATRVASERKLWEYVVSKHPKELTRWIEGHMYESLVILTNAGHPAIGLENSRYVKLRDRNRRELPIFIERSSRDCKYAQALLVLGVAHIKNEHYVKDVDRYDTPDHFVCEIELDEITRLTFLDFEKSASYKSPSFDQYLGKMRLGTEPLIKFIKSVIDPMLASPKGIAMRNIEHDQREIESREEQMKELIDKNAFSEKRTWRRVVNEYSDSVEGWIISHPLETLMVLNKVDAISKRETESKWVVTRTANESYCEAYYGPYADIAIGLGFGKYSRGKTFKIADSEGHPRDFESKIAISDGDKTLTLDFLEIDTHFLRDDVFHYSLKPGTEPLIEYMKKIVESSEDFQL